MPKKSPLATYLVSLALKAEKKKAKTKAKYSLFSLPNAAGRAAAHKARWEALTPAEKKAENDRREAQYNDPANFDPMDTPPPSPNI
jgi:hypothetical protein